MLIAPKVYLIFRNVTYPQFQAQIDVSFEFDASDDGLVDRLRHIVEPVVPVIIDPATEANTTQPEPSY